VSVNQTNLNGKYCGENRGLSKNLGRMAHPDLLRIATAHTFSARLLFDETFAQPDVFAVVNCPAVALSVFCSTVFNAQPYIFAAVNCADVTECVLLPCFNALPIFLQL